MSSRAHGLAVTVLEAADRVMSRVVCAEVSAFYHAVHEAAGVQIRYGAAVREFAGDDRVDTVLTDDGTAYPCDLVVAGIGIVPVTALAEQAGLDCDDGICVDDRAQTSEPGIFAAGDCTSHPNAIFGRRVRLESVHNAIEQSKTAALGLLGESASYTQVPWFWSDQYDLKLQIAGLSHGHDRIALRGSPDERRFAAYYLRDGILIAVDAINSPKDFLLGKKLIASRARLEPDQIRDPASNLDSLARAAD